MGKNGREASVFLLLLFVILNSTYTHRHTSFPIVFFSLFFRVVYLLCCMMTNWERLLEETAFCREAGGGRQTFCCLGSSFLSLDFVMDVREREQAEITFCMAGGSCVHVRVVSDVSIYSHTKGFCFGGGKDEG